jgi:hypothetical protein
MSKLFHPLSSFLLVFLVLACIMAQISVQAKSLNTNNDKDAIGFLDGTVTPTATTTVENLPGTREITPSELKEIGNYTDGIEVNIAGAKVPIQLLTDIRGFDFVSVDAVALSKNIDDLGLEGVKDSTLPKRVIITSKVQITIDGTTYMATGRFRDVASLWGSTSPGETYLIPFNSKVWRYYIIYMPQNARVISSYNVINAKEMFKGVSVREHMKDVRVTQDVLIALAQDYGYARMGMVSVGNKLYALYGQENAPTSVDISFKS